MATEVTVTLRFEQPVPLELSQQLEDDYDCVVVAGPDYEEV